MIPGPLYNQPTVPLSALLAQYPLYGRSTNSERWGWRTLQHVEVRVQKRFSKGYNFLFGYVYIREKFQQFNNELETYQNQLSWQDSNQPHHRITAAGSYELPFGKGKAFLVQHAARRRCRARRLAGHGRAHVQQGDYPRFGNV